MAEHIHLLSESWREMKRGRTSLCELLFFRLRTRFTFHWMLTLVFLFQSEFSVTGILWHPWKSIQKLCNHLTYFRTSVMSHLINCTHKKTIKNIDAQGGNDFEQKILICALSTLLWCSVWLFMYAHAALLYIQIFQISLEIFHFVQSRKMS